MERAVYIWGTSDAGPWVFRTHRLDLIWGLIQEEEDFHGDSEDIRVCQTWAEIPQRIRRQPEMEGGKDVVPQDSELQLRAMLGVEKYHEDGTAWTEEEYGH